MYVHHTRSYFDRDGQHTMRAPYLILFDNSSPLDPAPSRELRYCIRRVALTQCGHFMMGSAQVGPYRISLSGSCGNDGLPCDAKDYPGLWERLPIVPPGTAEAYWTSHDGVPEGFRTWAAATYTLYGPTQLAKSSTIPTAR